MACSSDVTAAWSSPLRSWIFPSNACEAAKSGKDRRWLSREAPQLPLPGCNWPSQCRCTYQHHEDRRTGGRRAEDLDAFARPVGVTTERRKRRDRRQPKD